jgi:hypothetical protein
MAQEVINIGAQADDGSGDTIRGTGIKINANFTELYAMPFAQTSLGLVENEISTTQSNADLVLKPSGSGSILFPAIRINNNNIEGTRTNDDLILRANGSGSLVVDGIGIAGTSITALDSSFVNINENLIIDGTLSSGITTFGGTVQTASTVDVDELTTLSTLTVSGVSTFADTTTVDNLTFNDNIISSSSNADINLTPGGTGVVNVSNLTIDSNINLTDNVIKVTRTNDDFVLSANGTGSVQISKVDINEGTIDDTVIGGTTPAAGTFTTISITNPSVTADKVIITDNKIESTETDADLQINANGGSGNVLINGFTFPNTMVGGQLIRTNGSKVLSTHVFPFVVTDTDVQDATATITGNSSAQVIDTFSVSTYRSAKYYIQISDATADRYTIIDANVTHNGTNAFVSTFGAATNGDGDGSTIYDSIDLSADINGGNVRLLGTVNNTNNQVIKLVKRVIKV